jgi:hypothetical protein
VVFKKSGRCGRRGRKYEKQVIGGEYKQYLPSTNKHEVLYKSLFRNKKTICKEIIPQKKSRKIEDPPKNKYHDRRKNSAHFPKKLRAEKSKTARSFFQKQATFKPPKKEPFPRSLLRRGDISRNPGA